MRDQMGWRRVVSRTSRSTTITTVEDVWYSKRANVCANMIRTSFYAGRSEIYVRTALVDEAWV